MNNNIKFVQRKQSLINEFSNDICLINKCYLQLIHCSHNLLNYDSISLNVFLKTDIFAQEYCIANNNMYNTFNDISNLLFYKQKCLRQTLCILRGDRITIYPTVKEVCSIISTVNNTFFQFLLGTIDTNSNVSFLVHNKLYDKNILIFIYKYLKK
jgi:hypothetical protein